MRGSLVAKAFVSKAKKQLFVIGVLLILASLLLHLFLMLLLDYHENFFAEHERLHSEHILADFAVTDASAAEYIDRLLQKEEAVAEYELTRLHSAQGNCNFQGGAVLTYFSCLSVKEATEKKIGRAELYEDSGTSGVYLPYSFLANGECKVGEPFTFTVQKRTISVPVAGFYHSVTTGTYNCSDISLLFTDDYLPKAQETFASPSLRVSVRLKEPSAAEKTEADLLNSLLRIPGVTLHYSVNYIKLSVNRYTMEKLCFGVVCACAVVTVITLLSLIGMCLSRYVRDNLRNFGMLKAIGYVSRELMKPPILLSAAGAAVCSFIGIGLSYAVFPFLNRLMEWQVGIPYTVRFLPMPLLLTVAVLLLTVTGTAYLSVRKIRRISPLSAIRGETSRRKTRRSCPLESTRLPLSAALALKTAVNGKRKNAVVFFTMLFVSFMLGFFCFCEQFILRDTFVITKLVVGNVSDSRVYLTGDEEAFCEELRNRKEVESFCFLYESTVSHAGGGKLSCEVTDAAGERESTDSCIEGVLPRRADEVAVNTYYAQKYGLSVGDTVTLSAAMSADFTVSGITQGAAFSGRNILLLREGYERLAPLTVYGYAICLQEGCDADAFNHAVEEQFPTVVRTLNYRSFLNAQQTMYGRVMSVLGTAMAVLCLVITAFVLYILLDMLLYEKRREHGILKALGFVSGQLVNQTALSFMPLAVPAVALGLWLSRDGIGRLISLTLRTMGISDIGCRIDVTFLLLCGAALLLFTFACTCLLSLSRVKNVTPRALFNNE